MYDLFLASADKPVTQALYDELVALGVRVFFDAVSVLPGQQWNRVIPAAQRDSRVTVVMITHAFDEAFYLGDEVATGIARYRQAPDAHLVIPVFVDGIPRDAFAIPYGLRVLKGLDVPQLGGIAALAARLRDVVNDLRQAPSGPTSTPTPATAASPKPTGDPRCERAALHARLCRLNPDQFDVVLLHANIDRSIVVGPTVPLSRRALDVVDLVAQGDDETCRRVCEAITKTAPWLT